MGAEAFFLEVGRLSDWTGSAANLVIRLDFTPPSRITRDQLKSIVTELQDRHLYLRSVLNRQESGGNVTWWVEEMERYRYPLPEMVFYDMDEFGKVWILNEVGERERERGAEGKGEEEGRKREEKEYSEVLKSHDKGKDEDFGNHSFPSSSPSSSFPNPSPPSSHSLKPALEYALSSITSEALNWDWARRKYSPLPSSKYESFDHDASRRSSFREPVSFTSFLSDSHSSEDVSSLLDGNAIYQVAFIVVTLAPSPSSSSSHSSSSTLSSSPSSTSLYLILNHSLSDTQSLLIASREILEKIYQPSPSPSSLSSSSSSSPLSLSDTVPRSVDQVMPESFKSLPKAIWYGSKFFFSLSSALSSGKTVSVSNRTLPPNEKVSHSTIFAERCISSEVIRRLKVICSHYGITLHGPLSAASIYSQMIQSSKRGLLKLSALKSAKNHFPSLPSLSPPPSSSSSFDPIVKSEVEGERERERERETYRSFIFHFVPTIDFRRRIREKRERGEGGEEEREGASDRGRNDDVTFPMGINSIQSASGAVTLDVPVMFCVDNPPSSLPPSPSPSLSPSSSPSPSLSLPSYLPLGDGKHSITFECFWRTATEAVRQLQAVDDEYKYLYLFYLMKYFDKKILDVMLDSFRCVCVINSSFSFTLSFTIFILFQF